MKIAVGMSDGHGGDYRSAMNADIAIVDLSAEQCAFLRDAVEAILVGPHSADGLLPLDEIRFIYPFRVYSDLYLLNDDDGNPRAEFEWMVDNWGIPTLLPDDFEVPDDVREGRIECCSVAIDGDKHLQFHCLPDGDEGWLRSLPFSLEELKKS